MPKPWVVSSATDNRMILIAVHLICSNDEPRMTNCDIQLEQLVGIALGETKGLRPITPLFSVSAKENVAESTVFGGALEFHVRI